MKSQSQITKDNKRTYRVITQSGSRGWRSRLQVQYQTYSAFRMFSETYNLAARLGYDSAEKAWVANPVIEGSVFPDDYRKVSD